MFRRKKTSKTVDTEPSASRKWSFKKKSKESKYMSSASINVDVPIDRNHVRSATEPAKIDLNQKIYPERVPSSIDAAKKSFQRHFPRLYFTGEVVIKSFTCALEKDIIMQGKLYLTPQYACFYSNVFNRNYTLEISYSQVTKIEKKNTIGMIPNAISVWIEGDVHFFLSFAKRDLAFDLMVEFWENQKIVDSNLPSFEVLNKPSDDDMFSLNDVKGKKHIYDNGSGNSTLVVDRRSISQLVSAASSSFPESNVGTPSFATTPSVAANLAALGSPPDQETADLEEASMRRNGRSPRGSLSFSYGPNFGPSDPLNWELLEIILEVDFLNVFAQLLSDSWNSWTHIHKICGTNGMLEVNNISGLFVGNWKNEGDYMNRTLIYSPTIKMPQCIF
jgi:hypothetical protein